MPSSLRAGFEFVSLLPLSEFTVISNAVEPVKKAMAQQQLDRFSNAASPGGSHALQTPGTRSTSLGVRQSVPMLPAW
jgi:hypothetical protein